MRDKSRVEIIGVTAADVVVAVSDPEAAAKRMPAWKPSEPVITHIAAPSLPSLQETAVRILEELRTARAQLLAKPGDAQA
jgi:hypothetical protein